ncbi:hypothetical protein V5F44_13445 [Xanthobacter sp. V2C-8]|uniref:hypothetical protein n=1 Tax=Xanthobacter albus TaxID=3119929 RepID=UPI003728EE5A
MPQVFAAEERLTIVLPAGPTRVSARPDPAFGRMTSGHEAAFTGAGQSGNLRKCRAFNALE